MFDDFDTQIQCEEIYDFEPTADDYEDFDDDIDTVLDDTVNGVVLDDEDEDLLDADGGVTGAGYDLLARMDARGEFV